MKKINKALKISSVVAVASALCRSFYGFESLQADTYLKPLVDSVDSDQKAIVGVTKADKIASELENVDKERDEIIRKLGKLIDGWTVMPDERAELANALLAVFKKFGKQIATAPYAEESLLIKSMISDFRAEGLADAIKLDGVEFYLGALEKAQEKFDLASDSFRDTKIEKFESPTVIKKRILSTINDKIAVYVTAMADSKGADYKAFAAKVDATIAEAK